MATPQTSEELPDKREKFCSACKENDFETVFKMIETDKCNPEQSLLQSYGQKPLHCAALNGNLHAMKELVERYRCKPNCKDRGSSTPLHYACYYGHLDVAKYLVVEQKCDPHMITRGRGRKGNRLRDRKDTTSLHYALKISSFALPDASTETAVSEKGFEVVKFLVTNYHWQYRKGNVTLGQALMRVVCQYGTLEFMKQLVEEKQIEPTKQSDKTLLVHTACKYGNLEILQYLIEDRKFKMMCDTDGNTPLHQACGASQLQVVQFLIESKLCEITAENSSGETPFHAACAAPQPSLDIVKLVSENCDPNCKTKQGDTPLHIACKGGSVELVNNLVEKGSDPTIANNGRKLPVHYASEHSLEIVKLVMVPLPKLKQYSQVAPLNIACSAGKLAIVQYFIEEMQCNPYIEDGRGLSPLHYACGCTENYYYTRHSNNKVAHIDIVEYLVSECECDPMENRQGYSPYEFACKSGNVKLAKALVSADIDCQDDGGNTPLHIASENMQESVVLFLVSEECDQSIQNENGELALHIACSIYHYEAGEEQLVLNIVKLVSNCSNIDAVTKAGETALHIACRNGYTDIVQFLTEEKKCNQNIQNENGELALHIAFSIYHYDAGKEQLVLNIVKLVSNCSKIDAVTKEGETALHIACKNGYTDIVQFLTEEKKCNQNIQNKEGKLPLHVACSRRSLNMVKLVSDCDVHCMESSGKTALHIACKGGQIDIVRYLVLERQCFSSACPEVYQDLQIHVACKEGDLELVKAIATNNNINCRDDSGNCPLHIACKYAKLDVVLFLSTEMQCNQEITNESGELALHIACAHTPPVSFPLAHLFLHIRWREEKQSGDKTNTSLEMVKLVSNCSPDCQRHDSETPLHIACKFSDSDVVSYLVCEKNCNVNVCNRNYETALHIACARPVFDVKAVSNCTPNAKDRDGNTPLHIACKSGNIKAVQHLIEEKKYDPSITNANKELPVHYACKHTLKMVRLVENCNVDSPTSWKETPLHTACSCGHLNIVRHLIEERHCDPHVEDELGLSALHYACGFQGMNIQSPYQHDYIYTCRQASPGFYRGFHQAHPAEGYQDTKELSSKNIKVAQYLVSRHGCDPLRNAPPLGLACKEGNLELLIALTTTLNVNNMDKAGNTTLHLACMNDQVELVTYLVKDQHCSQIVKNQKGELPLHIACRESSLDVVKLVSNKSNIKVNDTTVTGDTPLHIACRRNIPEVVNYLINIKECNPSILNKEVELPLHIASAKSLELVKLLSGCQLDYDAKTAKGDTALHIAWREGYHDIVEYLVHVEGSDPTIPDTNQSIPICVACEKYDFEMVKVLATHTSVNCKDQMGNSPLHIACIMFPTKRYMYTKRKKVYIPEKLLDLVNFLTQEMRCNQSIVNNKGKLALHIACAHTSSNHLDFVKLVSDCDDPNVKDEVGNTPLHIACQNCAHDVVEYLVGIKGCDVTLKNKNEELPLHIASSKTLQLVKLVFTSNCDHKTMDGNTPLHIACEHDNTAIAVYLVTEMQCNPSIQNNKGEIPLHIACHKMNLKMVKTVSNCKNPDLQDVNGDTPLHVACKSGKVEIMKYLLKLDINASIQNNLGDTALHIACRNLMKLRKSKKKEVAPLIDIVQSLLGKDQSSADVPNEEAELPLHLVCHMSRHAIQAVEMVSKHTTSPNFQSKFGNTPLHIACKNSTHDVVKHLVNERRCDTSLANSNGELPLHIACSQGSLAMAKIVFSQSANSNAPIKEVKQSMSKPGDTPLHIACRKREINLVRFLIQKSCNPSMANSCGELPLHIACEIRSLKILKLVSCCHGDLNRQTVDGSTALHIACKRADLEIIKFLLHKKYCDATVQNSKGDTPLHIACQLNKEPLVKSLCETWFSGQRVQNKEGELPLHIACKHMSSLNVVKMVSKCDVNALTNDEGNTPLHLACRNQYYGSDGDVIKYLVKEKQCNVNIPNAKGELPLHRLCAKKASVDSVKLVSNCDVNAQTYEGRDTPLHLACAQVHHYDLGNWGVVTYLIEEKHCDLDISNSKGELSLHIACRSGSLELVKFVSNCNVNSQMLDGNTPLHIACSVNDVLYSSSESESIVGFLVKEKHCSVMVQNENKELPMHIACRHQRLDTMKLVLEGEMNVKTVSGDTPLHEACKNDRYGTEIVTYLVDVNKCNPAIKNNDNELPLHLACQRGSLEMIKVLSKHNESRNTQVQCALACQSNDGKTPMHYLCERNAIKAIQYLLSSGKLSKQAISLSDITDQTPIMLATAPEVIRVLIAYGADPTPLYKMHQKFFERYSSEQPPPTPLNILVVGNASTGKTTLIESLKREGNTSGYQQGAQEHTAGIIPNKFESEIYGLVIMYDFAGQREYYASHGGVFHGIIRHSPPIFLLVVNVSEDERCIKQNILYWLSFIETQCSKSLKSSPHLIIVGSHADKLMEKGRDPKTTISQVMQSLHSRFKWLSVKFVGSVTMDCRECQSADISDLRKHLQQSSNQLGETVVMNFTCHHLYVHLLDKFQEMPAVPYSQMSAAFVQPQHVSSMHQFYRSEHSHSNLDELLPTNHTEMIQILEELNDRGHILFVKDPKHLQRSWVILNKEALLGKIHGSVFAPKDFKQHHPDLASSTGVVPFSKIAHHFPEYDPNMIAAFLSQMEFCLEINDREVLELMITSSVEKRVPLDPSDKYFFFPNLVNIDTPQTICESRHAGYQCGWLLHCTQQDQFFTPHFLQVLLLRLIFAFALVPGSPSIADDMPVVKRICSVWKSGIHWQNRDGIETVVEVIEHSQAVRVMMHCLECTTRLSVELNCIHLRSLIIQKVLDAKEEFCPRLFTSESFIHPKNLQYPPKPCKEMTLFSIGSIAKSVVGSKPFIVSDTGQSISIEQLLCYESYNSMGEKVLESLFKQSNNNDEVKDRFLSEMSEAIVTSSKEECMQLFKRIMMHERSETMLQERINQAPAGRIHELMRVFQVWRDCSDTPTYSSLRRELDRFSIFCGRNPLELRHTPELVYCGDPIVEAVDSQGKLMSCINNGITISIPPDAIPKGEKAVLRIQSCAGNFLLPRQIEMASPAYLLSSTAAVHLQKEVEVSIVHFMHLRSEEDCYRMFLLVAPWDPTPTDDFRMGYHFECLEGAKFWPQRVISTVSLKHFSTCIIAVGRLKDKHRMEKAYIAQLHSPTSPPDSAPYDVICTLSLCHPLYLTNLEEQLRRQYPVTQFQTESHLLKMTDDVQLVMPEDTMKKVGYNVSAVGYSYRIARREVDVVVRNRSRVENEYEYPPRIHLRVSKTFPKNVPEGRLKEMECTLKVVDSVEKCSFGLVLPMTTSSTTERRKSTPRKPKLLELIWKVGSKIASKWYKLGLKLKLEDSLLRTISRQKPPEKCCTEMFKEWLARPYLDPSWRNLVSALQSEDVFESRLAQDISHSLDV